MAKPREIRADHDRMPPISLLLGLAGALVLAGCGSAGKDPGASGDGAAGTTATGATTGTSTSASSSGGSVFSCDFSISGTHECAELADLAPADVPSQQSACAARMGTQGSGCPKTGQRLGTCTLSEGGVTETVIFYVGAGLTGFEGQTACTSYGGTWTPGS